MKIILGQNTGQAPKRVLLKTAWLAVLILSRGFTWRDTVSGLSTRQTTMTFHTRTKREAETELMDACKASHTWLCSCEQLCWTGAQGNEALALFVFSTTTGRFGGFAFALCPSSDICIRIFDWEKGLLLWERTAWGILGTKPSAKFHAVP